MSRHQDHLTEGVVELPIVTHEVVTNEASNAERKYHIWTIGCQMNIADSNHVAAELENIGYGPTD
jgi:tRNA-2-methylthio-N6-dimethylallyladenosine synthase